MSCNLVIADLGPCGAHSIAEAQYHMPGSHSFSLRGGKNISERKKNT